jgi:hypothetical protein
MLKPGRFTEMRTRMDKNSKRLKQQYKQNPRPVGVFLIRNMVNDKVLVGVGLDLAGIINRHKFQLTMGIHQNPRLQTEWNEFGSSSFAFEILDQLPPREDPDVNYREELAFMEKLWLEQAPAIR